MAETDVQDALVVEISDEQFLAETEKRTGTKFENIDTLKEKVTYQPPPPKPPDPTDAEKEKSAKDFEKRMLDVHIEQGKTLEQYTLLKSFANGDLKELSLNQTKAELKEAKFTDEQIAEILKERYYQVDDKDIELEDNPETKDLLKKKKEFGTKKLQGRAAYIQNQAKQYIESLTKAVNDSDAEKKRMELHSSKVEDAIKNYQRKQTLELGKVDDADQADSTVIPPFEDEVPETALAEVKEILKDPEKFEKQLFTKDGDVNLDFILPHLVRSASYTSAVKKGYLVGATRQVEHYESIMGSDVPGLGAPKKPGNETGKVVRKGKSEFVAPAT